MSEQQPRGPVDLRDVNDALAAALVRARTHLGLTSMVEMAELMNRVTGGQGPDVSTYRRWEEGRRRVPGWALLVAAYASGLSTSQLLEEPPAQEMPLAEFTARYRRLEREVREIREMIEPLIAELQRRQGRRQARGQAS